MTIQTIRCGVCETLIAACKTEYADDIWFKDVARYVKRGHKFNTETPDVTNFDKPLNDCCKSKKSKQ